MRKLFNRLSLSSKLVISAIIPLLALAYYFYIIQSDRQVRTKTTENFISRLNTTIAANNLIDQLQQERRFSLSYLFKKRNENDLINQRKEVSLAFVGVEESFKNGFNEDFKKFAFVNDLHSWREKIDKGELPAVDILLNYQLLIDRLLGSTNIKTDNPAIIETSGNQLDASSSMARMINLIALMRLEIYLDLMGNTSISSLIDNFQ